MRRFYAQVEHKVVVGDDLFNLLTVTSLIVIRRHCGIIKPVSNKNYLELLNRSAEFIHLSVSLRGSNNSEPVGKMKSARILVDEELIRS